MRKLRRSLAFVVAFAMILTTLAVVNVTAAEFSDTNGHWAESVIDEWSDAGVINGYSDGTFLPDANISRAELAKVISVAMGYETTVEISFSDVLGSDWFAEDVAKCVAQGVVGGYDDGTFRPDDAVTREEAATMFQRAYKINTEGLLTFTDTDSISEWAKTSVTALVGSGVISGYDDGTFRPANPITRAEVVKILDGITIAATDPLTTASTSSGTNTVASIGNLGHSSSGGSSSGGSSGSSSSSSIKIIFNANGGYIGTSTSASTTTISITKGGVIGSKAPSVSRDDYVFSGWYKTKAAAESLDSTYLIDTSSTTFSTSTTVYAGWGHTGKVLVRFVKNGGTPDVQSQVVEVGGKATKPTTTLTRDHYTFVGWYPSNTSSTEFDFDNTTITSETYIYAKWQVDSEYSGKEVTVQKETVGTYLSGTVEAEPASALPGETVKLKITPPSASSDSVAYETDYISAITYTSTSGEEVQITSDSITENSDGTFSFTVPDDAQGVFTVKPYFIEVSPTASPAYNPDPTVDPYEDPDATPTPTPAPVVTDRPIVDPTYEFSDSVYSEYTFTNSSNQTVSGVKANTETGGITVSKDSVVDSSSKKFDETQTSYSMRLKIGTATLSFKVTGPCEIRIDAVSASSADREYEVWAGSEKLGSCMCLDDATPTGTFYYYGSGEGTITIKPLAGINVYGIFVDYNVDLPDATATPEATATPAVYTATVNVTGGTATLSGDGLVKSSGEDGTVSLSADKPGPNDELVRQETAKMWTPADNYETLRTTSGAAEGSVKFDVVNMNMDNLYLQNGSKLIGYENLHINQSDPEYVWFPDGTWLQAQIFCPRLTTMYEFYPSETKKGTLRMYYHYASQMGGTAMVSVTQGDTTVDGTIGTELADTYSGTHSEGNTHYSGIVEVSINEYDKVTITSKSNTWLMGISYTPEGDEMVSPTAPPNLPTAEPEGPENEYKFTAGSTVNVSTTADEEGAIATIKVTGADGTAVSVSGSSFVMPSQDVTVDVTFAVPQNAVTWVAAETDVTTDPVDPAAMTVGGLTVDPLSNTLAASDDKTEATGAWSISGDFLTGSQNPKSAGQGGVSESKPPTMGTALKVNVTEDGMISANINIGKGKTGYVYEFTTGDSPTGTVLCTESASSDASLTTDFKFNAKAGYDYYILVSGSKAKFGNITFVPGGSV